MLNFHLLRASLFIHQRPVSAVVRCLFVLVPLVWVFTWAEGVV